MATFKQACIKEVTDKLLTLEKNKRKCVFINPDKHILKKITVDGCQIIDNAKCDYLVIDHLQNEYFVELKGKDLPHAVEQLEESIKQLSNTNINSKKFALIVASRHPSNDTTIQRAKAVFKKKYKIDLISKNTLMKVEITSS